jgi:hypothetical protein
MAWGIGHPLSQHDLYCDECQEVPMADRRGRQPSRNQPSKGTRADKRLKRNRKPGAPKPGPKRKR